MAVPAGRQRELKAAHQGRSQRILTAAARALLTIFAPSLHAYFFWSLVIYLTVLAILLVYRPRIEEFLCNVSPPPKEGGVPGTGCWACTDKLLLCRNEDVCYQSAVNATYRAFALTPEDPLYQALIETSTDTTCLVAIAGLPRTASPVDALKKLVAKGSDLSLGCRLFHCEVLRVALREAVWPREDGARDYGVGAACHPGIYGNITWSQYCPIPAAILENDAARRLGGCGSDTDTSGTSCDEPNNAPERELTENLPPYTVTAWSRCTCLQRCMPGVRTRLVSCEASACRAPEPARIQACHCTHCARCLIGNQLFAGEIIVFSQAGIALFAFLAYLSSSTLKEDRLVKIPWLQMLPGSFCKFIPPMVKYLVVANMLSLIVLCLRIYLPRLFPRDFSEDCFASEDLRVVFLASSSLWAFQVALSTCARRHTRSLPWLYTPARASWIKPIKYFRMFFRLFGP